MPTQNQVLVVKHRGLNVERRAFATGAGNDPNTNFIFDVVRGMNVGYHFLNLRGSLVISVGAANGTSLGPNPGNLLQRVQVECNPGGFVKSLLPRSIISRSVFDRGWLRADTALTGAAGTFTLLQPYWLRYALPRAPVPYETALQTDRFKSVQIRALGGGRTTQFTGNDRTWDFTGVTLDLSEQREQMGGDTALLYEEDIVITIPAANPAQLFTGFSTGSRYHDILFVAETTNQALADTIINRITVQSGALQFFDGLEDEIKVNQQDWFSDAAVAALGLYFAPMNPDLLLRGAVDTIPTNQLSARLDVAAPGAGADRIIAATRRVLLPEDIGS